MSSKNSPFFKDKSADFKRAYDVYTGQLERCNNKNSKTYKWYGAKGIKVNYARQEFIDWYIEALKSFKYHGKARPSVGRIDHSKHYSLDNICMESVSSNAKERFYRCGHNLKTLPRVGLFSKNTMECLAIFKSTKDCADYFDVSFNVVKRACLDTTKSILKDKYSWHYRYLDQNDRILKNI